MKTSSFAFHRYLLEQIEFTRDTTDQKEMQCSNTRIIDRKVEGWRAVGDSFVNFLRKFLSSVNVNYN